MLEALQDLREVAEWDWVQIDSAGATILHAPAIIVGPDDLVPVGGPGWTVCGRSGRLGIPGFGSRMAAPRCKQCCRRLGWPHGVGSPKNDAELRPLVEARLASRQPPARSRRGAVRGRGHEHLRDLLEPAIPGDGSLHQEGRR